MLCLNLGTGTMDVGTLHFMSFPEVGKGERPIAGTLERILQNDFAMAGENPVLVLANSKRVFKQAWALV
jgi:hypothetical protein